MTLNHLYLEKSPYLLQHQNNPVHWYAWGEEAFAAAKKENKPIFLSIGYSTCHWCHVMAHESFEDEQVAEVLNDKFIAIKVDREERPDVDDIYMSAVHAMGQRGGWPLSMFLTPDLKPFYGGTYWPKPYFLQILSKLDQLWREEPEKVLNSGNSLLQHLQEQKGFSSLEEESIKIDERVFQKFLEQSQHSYDVAWGGFGAAPKFPHAMQLSMLLRIHFRQRDSQALQMVINTLEKMARGGLYDHLGGGFARYSTDARWMIPHFEKMLYDNALLVPTYLEAFQITKLTMFESVARETLDYVLNSMTHPEGGFYSAEDADSEGVEGKFYVWSFEEIRSALSGEEFEHWIRVYNVTPEGNFEDKNHFNLSQDFSWEEKEHPLIQSATKKLLKLREARIHPHKDDKILTAWNGLMIRAMALGFQVTGQEEYLKAAHRAVAFIKNNLWNIDSLSPRGRGPGRGGAPLKARFRDGEARFAARLEDYAFLIQGLIDLYQCDFKPEILQWAVELQAIQDQLFWDEKGLGYFFTDGQDESLLIRSKEGMDGALPNGNGVSAFNLLRLFAYQGEVTYRDRAEKIFNCFSRLLNQHPQAFSQLLLAYDFFVAGSLELAILDKPKDGNGGKILEEWRSTFQPYGVVAKNEVAQEFPALLKQREVLNQKTTFYFCKNQTCQRPINDIGEAIQTLGDT